MKPVFVMLNKDRENHQHVYIPDVKFVLESSEITDVSLDYALSVVPQTLDYSLRPSEIKIIAAK